ncbi:unnamed protein product [Linum trigynum]|uniref:Uncharacterized protein n=1 Tax=Linum trigynum TaxID=586398 RepID=A0AAV2G9V8_9ROSI
MGSEKIEIQEVCLLNEARTRCGRKHGQTYPSEMLAPMSYFKVGTNGYAAVTMVRRDWKEVPQGYSNLSILGAPDSQTHGTHASQESAICLLGFIKRGSYLTSAHQI